MGRARNRTARITVLTPAQIAKRREAEENARLEREGVKKAAARRIENWGPNLDGGLYDFKRHVGTEMTTDSHGKPRGIWRTNPFTAMVNRGVINHDEGNAGMDLLRIYAASKGLEGAPEPGGVPDQTRDWGREDRRMYHIKLYGMVVKGLTLKSRILAEAFAVAIIEIDRPADWREIVELELKVSDPARQTVRFQVMCEELVDVIPGARKALRDQLDRAA